MSNVRLKYVSGRSGRYTCTRCGWKWTPRAGCPDPPRGCARCRSGYWRVAPTSARANSPEDPKWQAERDLVSRRRRQRHLVRLRELAAEFSLQPPPIENGRAVPSAPGVPQPAATWQHSGPLARELRRRMAELNSETPSQALVPEPGSNPPTLATRRRRESGETGYRTRNR